ncbi:MAG: CAP domain-containing protein [Candidatus Paceibacterota bacterium]
MYNANMISWLKKHFIPQDGNDNRPHILRSKNIRKVIFVLLFLEVFTFLIPTITRINNTGGMAAVLPAILANLTNEERQTQKLNTLAVNPTLNKAAEMKANDMATYGYFAHTSPEGKTPWYWLAKAGYEYQYAGENLAVNFTDSQDVTNAWMASPTHKANIVKGNYTEMGTGVANGMYEGRETVFVAQVYANPMPTPTAELKDIQNNIIKPQIQKEIKNITEVAKTVDIKEVANVLGAEIDTEIAKANITTPTFLQKIFSSPRNSTNVIFFIIFGIILLSLILNIIIRIKNHHPDLITNGLITLVIIGGILATNYYISHRNMIITSSLDYSSENK